MTRPAPPGLDWQRDAAQWPLREASRFVDAAGLRWHLQQVGQGPLLLLLHGTGASTHSWRGLVPLLQSDFTLLLVDLPGHGFTSMGSDAQFTLPGMAQALQELLRTLGEAPQAIVGHSAGAAIGAQLALTGAPGLRSLVGINGAFLQFGGLAGLLFPPAAKLLAALPWVPRLVSWRAADRASIERLIRSTGSTIDAEGIGLYSRLIANPGQVAATLQMMASWDLRELQSGLTGLRVPLSLLVGSNDQAVPPAQARQVQAWLPAGTASALHVLQGLGHLAHEERPDLVAPLVRQAASSGS
jgi:magnesium chelatase accessory protein